MTDNAYKPAGYCPHCGYAIDPGVCPECGKNVAASELDSVPYWVTRDRKLRRATTTRPSEWTDSASLSA
jgi:hypothetical protein